MDALSHDERVNWMRGLSRRELRSLYDLAASAPPMDVAFFHGEPDEIVTHHGQNSLLAFSTFEKRIVLRNGAAQGYNHTRRIVQGVAGPGHFTLQQDEQGVVFDYTVLPQDAPEAFPALQPNDTGGARWVFGGMVDRVRQVSEHCTIGRAYRNGKPENAWFMLVRQREQRT